MIYFNVPLSLATICSQALDEYNNWHPNLIMLEINRFPNQAYLLLGFAKYATKSAKYTTKIAKYTTHILTRLKNSNTRQFAKYTKGSAKYTTTRQELTFISFDH